MVYSLNHERERKVSSFLLVSLPLMTPYFCPFTSVPLPLVVMLLAGICFFLKGRRNYQKAVLPKSFKAFIIYACLIPVFGIAVYGDIGSFVVSYKGLIIFLCFLLFAIPYCSISYVSRYLSWIATIAIIVFVLQEIMYVFVGSRFSALIPFLDVSYEYMDMAQMREFQANWDRSSSFFLEPSHFSQYISAYLALLLGENANRGKIFDKKAIIVSVVLLLTKSGTALLLLMTLWLVFFLSINIKRHIKYLILLPGVAVIALIAYSKVISSDYGQEMMSRTVELSSESRDSSSGQIRVVRGFLVYSEIPIVQKVFGVGNGFATNVIDNSSARYLFVDDERYLNNIQTLLIGYGLVGLFLFLLFLFRISSCSNDLIPRFFCVTFFILSFMECFWLESKMLMLLAIPLIIYRNNLNLIER